MNEYIKKSQEACNRIRELVENPNTFFSRGLYSEEIRLDICHLLDIINKCCTNLASIQMSHPYLVSEDLVQRSSDEVLS